MDAPQRTLPDAGLWHSPPQRSQERGERTFLKTWWLLLPDHVNGWVSLSVSLRRSQQYRTLRLKYFIRTLSFEYTECLREAFLIISRHGLNGVEFGIARAAEPKVNDTR